MKTMNVKYIETYKNLKIYAFINSLGELRFYYPESDYGLRSKTLKGCKQRITRFINNK